MSRSPVKEFAKVVIGAGAEIVMPGLGRDLDEGRKTGKNLKLKRAILHSRIQRAKWRGDEAAAKKAVDDWWKSDVGDHYYEVMAVRMDRFEKMFKGDHYVMVNWLKDLCERDASFAHVVEVGCGDGYVTNHLSEVLPSIEDFIGLDISDRIIDTCNATYGTPPRVQFEAGNIIEWINREPRDKTILVSYGGVMEYLTQAELTGVYRDLRKSTNVAVALVEPLDAGFDPEKETTSRFEGTEHTYYTHNYKHILQDAGFDVTQCEYMSIAGWPWVAIMALPRKD